MSAQQQVPSVQAVQTTPGGQATTSFHALQVIYWGASDDLDFNAAGGASAQLGPFATTVLRLAIGKAQNLRIAVGDSTATATAESTLFVGPGVEFVPIISGQYVAALSDDAGTGSLNITMAI